MASIHYRTKGLFIKKEDKGEADQLFTVFTKDYGKLNILGRSIRKITSKLRSGADIYNLSEIGFIQGKNYKTLTDALLIKKYKNIDMIADSLDLLTTDEQDDNVYELLMKTLDLLDNKLTNHFFFWKLASLSGYAPELYSCPVCGKKLLPESFSFSYSCPGASGTPVSSRDSLRRCLSAIFSKKSMMLSTYTAPIREPLYGLSFSASAPIT